MAKRADWSAHPSETLRVHNGFSLAEFEHGATPGWEHGERAAVKTMKRRGSTLSNLQEMLHANAKVADGRRSVLLVLQGMDTSGKGGIVRHVVGMVDPQGVAHRSFGVPTDEENGHHYLWRVENALPTAGKIGVFDRSHFEQVLVVRVHNLVEPAVWGTYYDELNAFEAEVAAGGTTIIKCALMVSLDEQLRRLDARIHRADKHWKYNPGDLDERALWPDYMDAYQEMFDRCSTDIAPWHAVPADNKWFARLAVTELLTTAMQGLDLAWPVATFDVEAEIARIEALKGE